MVDFPRPPAGPADDLMAHYAQWPADDQRRLRLLAVFPATFDLTAAGAIWELADDPTSDSLGELLRGGWLSLDVAPNRHRLTEPARAVALAELTAAERAESEKRHAMYFLKALVAADEAYSSGGDRAGQALARWEADQANVYAGQAWAAAHAEQDPEAARPTILYELGAYLLRLRQHPRAHLAWLETALAAGRQLKNRRVEGMHLHDFGEIYAELGEPRRAIECYEQALAIDREADDREGEAEDSWRLGLSYEALGVLDKAIASMQFSVDYEREVGEPEAEANADHVEELRARLKGQT